MNVPQIFYEGSNNRSRDDVKQSIFVPHAVEGSTLLGSVAGLVCNAANVAALGSDEALHRMIFAPSVGRLSKEASRDLLSKLLSSSRLFQFFASRNDKLRRDGMSLIRGSQFHQQLRDARLAAFMRQVPPVEANSSKQLPAVLSRNISSRFPVRSSLRYPSPTAATEDFWKRRQGVLAPRLPSASKPFELAKAPTSDLKASDLKVSAPSGTATAAVSAMSLRAAPPSHDHQGLLQRFMQNDNTARVPKLSVSRAVDELVATTLRETEKSRSMRLDYGDATMLRSKFDPESTSVMHLGDGNDSVCGLVNEGNLCYRNSILQCLARCEVLGRLKGANKLTRALSDVLMYLSKGEKVPKDTMRGLVSSFEFPDAQEDASEIFLKLARKLRQNGSDLFQGKIWAAECQKGHPNEVYDFESIYVAPPTDGQTTLVDAISVAVKDIEAGLTCRSCTSKLKIKDVTFPNELVVHVGAGINEKGKVVKPKCDLVEPMINVKIGDNSQYYEVVGVIRHRGENSTASHTCGHYLAYVKQKSSGQWFLTNDREVELTDWNAIRKEPLTMYFLVKK